MKTAKEIYEWLKNQNYQTEIGEQEYRMYYAIDMPKILEQYYESRMKEELIKFLCQLEESTFYSDRSASDIIDNYLATRKNK
jgi:hypothetical protein